MALPAQSVARLVPLGRNPVSLPELPLRLPVNLVGRTHGCDLTLGFATISRRHCCFIHVNQDWLIRDLESRHGVYLNGQRVREAQLHHGDEVAIAQFLFRFERPEKGGS
ncbi:FHA domain containing protein [Isosphaera pallida ATCC 43644]|uniref:FHA domain containing protein n=1 Tax=Isosphaera pallida (strain ATCC 43644 / DSM 9630 / IS1B) TaxID=575540 RepID=E8R2N2_ISOPI|nr:FHA domain-containing protein [Isosphaera pallida]ADV62532.1 FHA domain containing protein [Isosphaera pallida ATCC 43644]